MSPGFYSADFSLTNCTLNYFASDFAYFRKMILSACGATVLSGIPKGKGRMNVDCCLLDSTTLPPHVISVPAYVSTLRQRINEDAPLLDLAWAHQSIIQRKRLPFKDARYAISLDRTMSNSCIVSSIRNKTGVRYEVGDLVQFNLGAKRTSFGRIIGIVWERQLNGFKLKVQVLVRCSLFWGRFFFC